MGLRNSGFWFSQAIILFVATLAIGLLSYPTHAEAQQYASQGRKDTAKGHYARARAMLVEALAEFEQGRKLARPDMLLDPEEWRISVISRTEELNRLLDPKPRVTKYGVRFRANPRMVRREHQRIPQVRDGAKISNTYEEDQRRLEQEAARGQMRAPQAPPVWQEQLGQPHAAEPAGGLLDNVYEPVIVEQPVVEREETPAAVQVSEPSGAAAKKAPAEDEAQASADADDEGQQDVAVKDDDDPVADFIAKALQKKYGGNEKLSEPDEFSDNPADAERFERELFTQ